MSTCPICGKDTKSPRELTVNGKKLVNLCSVCQSYLICLVKPVSVSSRKNAQDWAEAYMQKNRNPYIIDVLRTCYNYSLTEDSQNPADAEKKEPSVVIQKEPYTPGQTFAQPGAVPVSNANYQTASNNYNYPSALQPRIKTKYTAIVKIMVYISYALFLIGGGALGAISGEFIGIFFGALGGLIVGVITNSIVMMLVETAENTAIGAEAALRNEITLAEIKNSLENSQK